MADAKISSASIHKITITLKSGFTDAINKTLYALSGDIKKIYDQYTPKLTGDLRKNTDTKVVEEADSGYLAFYYRQPYAYYQYKNHFQNYSTPGTGGEWDKVAEAEVKQKVADEYKKQLKNTFG